MLFLCVSCLQARKVADHDNPTAAHAHTQKRKKTNSIIPPPPKKQIRRLRAALPPALDVGAMVAAFPGLACMDVGSNVRLKVRTWACTYAYF